MLTSFKEGSVRVQAPVRLQAPTFLGQEGTRIETVVTFPLQTQPTSNTDERENRWNVPLISQSSQGQGILVGQARVKSLSKGQVEDPSEETYRVLTLPSPVSGWLKPPSFLGHISNGDWPFYHPAPSRPFIGGRGQRGIPLCVLLYLHKHCGWKRRRKQNGNRLVYQFHMEAEELWKGEIRKFLSNSCQPNMYPIAKNTHQFIIKPK